MSNASRAIDLFRTAFSFLATKYNNPVLYIIQQSARSGEQLARSISYLYALRRVLLSAPSVPMRQILTELMPIPFSSASLCMSFLIDRPYKASMSVSKKSLSAPSASRESSSAPSASRESSSAPSASGESSSALFTSNYFTYFTYRLREAPADKVLKSYLLLQLTFSRGREHFLLHSNFLFSYPNGYIYLIATGDMDRYWDIAVGILDTFILRESRATQEEVFKNAHQMLYLLSPDSWQSASDHLVQTARRAGVPENIIKDAVTAPAFLAYLELRKSMREMYTSLAPIYFSAKDTGVSWLGIIRRIKAVQGLSTDASDRRDAVVRYLERIWL